MLPTTESSSANFNLQIQPSPLDQRIAELLAEHEQQQNKKVRQYEFFRFAPYSNHKPWQKVIASESLFQMMAVSFYRNHEREINHCLSPPINGKEAAAPWQRMSMSTVRLQAELRGHFPEAYKALITEQYGGRFHDFVARIPGFALFQFTTKVFSEHPELEWYFSVDELRYTYEGGRAGDSLVADLHVAQHIQHAVCHDLVAFCQRCCDQVLQHTCWMTYAAIRTALWLSTDEREYLTQSVEVDLQTDLQTSSNLSMFCGKNNKGGWSRKNTALTELVWKLTQKKPCKRITAPLFRYATDLLLEMVYVDPDELTRWILPPAVETATAAQRAGLLPKRAVSVPIMGELSHAQQRRFMIYALLRSVVGPELPFGPTYEKSTFCVFIDDKGNRKLQDGRYHSQSVSSSTAISSHLMSSPSTLQPPPPPPQESEEETAAAHVPHSCPEPDAAHSNTASMEFDSAVSGCARSVLPNPVARTRGDGANKNVRQVRCINRFPNTKDAVGGSGSFSSQSQGLSTLHSNNTASHPTMSNLG